MMGGMMGGGDMDIGIEIDCGTCESEGDPDAGGGMMGGMMGG
jgi:hypothetical protein